MKLILVVFLSACSALVYADDSCESAVDAADSMNVNQQDCDYTDEGLNGVLHKAFKQGSEGAVLETATEPPAGDKKPAAAIAATKATKQFLLSVDLDQWSNVAMARAQLLPKAMEKCAKGFSVEREYYRPLAMGKISLSMEFRCLE